MKIWKKKLNEIAEEKREILEKMKNHAKEWSEEKDGLNQKILESKDEHSKLQHESKEAMSTFKSEIETLRKGLSNSNNENNKFQNENQEIISKLNKEYEEMEKQLDIMKKEKDETISKLREELQTLKKEKERERKESVDNHALVKNQLKGHIEKAVNDQREIGNISEQLKLREIEYLQVSKQLKEKNDQFKFLEGQNLDQKKKSEDEIANLKKEIEVLKQEKEIKEKETKETKETTKTEVVVQKEPEKKEIVPAKKGLVLPKFDPWAFFCGGITTGIMFAYFTSKFRS